MLRLVHDLKTNTYEYIDFQSVETSMRPRLPEHHDNQLVRSIDFVDHTDANNSYRSLRRNALRNSIYAYDFSDEVKSHFPNPCEVVFKHIRRHGDFAPHMLRAFTNILERKNFATALTMIQDADERLRANGIRFARTDEEIIELAKAKSRAFSKVLLKIENIQERFEKAELLLSDLGLSFRPELVKQKQKSGELDSLIKRACCDKWLRRQLRRRYFTEVETVARDLMLVHKSQDAYCSQYSVDVMKGRKSDSEQALINTVCYLDDDPDTWFTLQELAAKSTSNPMIRRAEMFVRLRAFEEIAKESGHVAMFYTVTAPSRFHVYKDNELNPKWVEAGRPTALDAHHHLMGVTNAFRKDLDKLGIKIYGLRIVEPHHDGTPHNHMLFFIRPEDKVTVTRLLRGHALSDSPNESGASKFRFKAETINWKKGSAVGYVAKYLSKNIDGENIGSDKGTDLDGKSASSAVVSFNRIQGIRQFQFYGGPSVTVWREMRRFREEFKEDDAVILGNELSKDEHFVLETIRKAADDGDFKRFIMAMGGVFVRRNDQEVKAVYAKKVNVDGLFKQTRYGDEMSAAIHGIMFKGKEIQTRFKDWKFANKKQFVRGIRSMMQGTTMIFDSLEDQEEYFLMKQEEYERIQEQCAFFFDMPSIEASVMYGDSIYAQSAPPPESCPSWAQPDWDMIQGGLDLCH